MSKGIYPQYISYWKHTAAGVNTTSTLIDNTSGVDVVSTSSNGYVDLGRYPVGEYTIYFKASLLKRVGGSDNTIKVVTDSTYYTDDITKNDQDISLNISIADHLHIYCGNNLGTDSHMLLRNIYVVPKDFPAAENFPGSKLDYHLKGTEQSIILQISKVVQGTAGNILGQLSSETTPYITFKTTTNANEIQLDIVTNSGVISNTFNINDFIAISFSSLTEMNIYKNTTLLGSYTLLWSRTSLRSCTFSSLGNSGMNISMLLFNKSTHIGYPLGTHLSDPHRQPGNKAFRDATDINAKDIVDTIALNGNSLQSNGVNSIIEVNDIHTDYDVSFDEDTIDNAIAIAESIQQEALSNIRMFSNSIVRSWTQVTVPSGYLYNVCYSENHSDDGITWNQLTVPTGALRSVCYAENLQRFVAVGYGSVNNIQYSDDGITWNQLTVPNGNLYGVCYAENIHRFVAVGYGSSNNIQYSDDGIVWIQVNTPDGELWSVCYSENLQRFVAVGVSSSNNIQYSSDGITWSSLNSLDGNLRGVCYSESLNRFVATGAGSSNNVQYSNDGISWNHLTVPNGYLNGGCYSKSLSKFVIVGSASSNNIQYTTI